MFGYIVFNSCNLAQ